MIVDILKQFEQFVVGGTFIAGIIFTKKMHEVYKVRIQELEISHSSIIKQLQNIEKELVKLNTELKYIIKMGAK